jgi:Domain of unknown function DUF11
MLEDPSPSGLVFHEARPSQGHCTITRELRCGLGNLHAGGEALVQLTATVAAHASGTTVNKATVWGTQGEPNQSNDTATTTVLVTPPPPGPPVTPPPRPGPGAQPVSDLVLRKQADRRMVLRGRRLRYTITVTNNGPDPAADLRVTDTPVRRQREVAPAVQGRPFGPRSGTRLTRECWAQMPLSVHCRVSAHEPRDNCSAYMARVTR